VVLARSLNPIPSRTRPLNSSAPMVLWLKPWESRSLPGLPRTRQFLFTCHDRTDAASPRGGGVFSFAGVFCFAVRPCRFVSAMICRQIPSDCASIRGRVHGDMLTMILLVAHGFYLLAGILPAYFLARNTGRIWRNLFAWLGGFPSSSRRSCCNLLNRCLGEYRSGTTCNRNGARSATSITARNTLPWPRGGTDSTLHQDTPPKPFGGLT
jgi:hypothetical protein